MAGINPLGNGGDVQPNNQSVGGQVQNSGNKGSVFSKYDQNQDSTITTEEMGINKLLTKILDNLPNTAKGASVANVIKDIRAIVAKLSGSITYDATNAAGLDAITKEVEARKADAKELNDVVSKMKYNAEKAAEQYKNLPLQSFGALEVSEHNEVAKTSQKANATEAANEALKAQAANQAETALTQLAEKAKNNAGVVNIGDIAIETMAGLEFKEVKVAEKYRKATGTENDLRINDGDVKRGLDGLVVSLTYEHNGERKTVEKVLDEIPEGYNAKHNVVEDRHVNITTGIVSEWD